MWITAVTIILLLIAIVVLIIYFTRSKVSSPIIRGSYAVQPNKTGTSMYICGASSNEECIFTANSLQDAINVCNRYLNICRQFAYTPGTIKFIQEGNYVDTTGSDVYLYQYKVDTVS